MYSPDTKGFQPYVGEGVELSFGVPSVFITDLDYSGTYLGITSFGGVEVGPKHVKLFAEAGIGVSALFAGEDNSRLNEFENDIRSENDLPSKLFIPCVSIGLNSRF